MPIIVFLLPILPCHVDGQLLGLAASNLTKELAVFARRTGSAMSLLPDSLVPKAEPRKRPNAWEL